MKMQELVKLHQDGNKKIVFSVSNDDDQRIKDGTHRMVIDVYGGLGFGSSFPLETFKKMTVGSVLEFSSGSALVMGTVRVEKNNCRQERLVG
jgi:urease beta subunit